MDQKQMESIIEGILFTFGEAVEPSRIAKALEVETKDVVKALEHMKETWAEEGRGVQLTELDGSYQMCTKPELYEYLIRMAKQPRKQVLTDVLLETLSIIAYKQPITRVEIEEIRGVGCDMMLRKLQARGLIREAGRSEAPGRPILFEVTEEFMDSFKLVSLNELPELPDYTESESEDLFE